MLILTETLQVKEDISGSRGPTGADQYDWTSLHTLQKRGSHPDKGAFRRHSSKLTQLQAQVTTCDWGFTTMHNSASQVNLCVAHSTSRRVYCCLICIYRWKHLLSMWRHRAVAQGHGAVTLMQLHQAVTTVLEAQCATLRTAAGLNSSQRCKQISKLPSATA